MNKIIKSCISLFFVGLRHHVRLKNTCNISSVSVRALLINQTGIEDKYYRNIRRTEENYYLVPGKKMKKLIEIWKYLIQDYSKLHDCDNFSSEFLGLANLLIPGAAIGEAWVHTENGNHAVNFYLDAGGRFTLIEPQNGKELSLKHNQPYFIKI